MGPGRLEIQGALQSATKLAQIAAATVEEGCVGETVAVLLATAQRENATDPAVRRVLERVIRDEQRHAELAWKFVRWALLQGEPGVEAAVRAAFTGARAALLASPVAEDPSCDLSLWQAHGRLQKKEVRAIVQNIGSLLDPCERALYERSTPSADARRAGAQPTA
jgi:hypothetical protein